MATQLHELMDYMEEECTEQECDLILDKVHSIALELLQLGDNGVLIANILAAQLNDHTLQREQGVPSPTLH